MKITRAIVIHKKTFYQFCFGDNGSSKRRRAMRFSAQDIRQFRKMDGEHRKTLAVIQDVLKKYRIAHRSSYRKDAIDYAAYDLVVTVGGDGTFLQAARALKGQAILGVNSDPSRSVGKFCVADSLTFERVLAGILSGRLAPRCLNRLRVTSVHLKRSFDVANDLLVCDRNPAAMSRYELSIGLRTEFQRSSGLWVSTAAGSTGAVHSAGGKALGLKSPLIQYRPRELYSLKGKTYLLRGGVLSKSAVVRLRSAMRHGVIYLDGAHNMIPFPFGDVVTIRCSPSPLRIFIKA